MMFSPLHVTGTHYMQWGAGTHQCKGMNVARLILKETLCRFLFLDLDGQIIFTDLGDPLADLGVPEIDHTKGWGQYQKCRPGSGMFR